MLSTDKLWLAYGRIDQNRVRGNNLKHRLTDLVSLVRYTLEREKNTDVLLEPYADIVARNFTDWLSEQERTRGISFTAEQRQWLELIRDHVAAALTIEQDDFESSPFIQRGGLGKAYQLFGDKLTNILQSLNERLAA